MDKISSVHILMHARIIVMYVFPNYVALCNINIQKNTNILQTSGRNHTFRHRIKNDYVFFINTLSFSYQLSSIIGTHASIIKLSEHAVSKNNWYVLFCLFDKQ